MKYLRSTFLLTAFVGSALLLHGCDVLSPSERNAAVRALTESEARIVHADNHFGLSVFRAISEKAPDENVFVSPLSISMALGMTLNGARDETRDRMRQTLALAGLSETEINASYRSLIDLLRSLDPTVRFQIANSIWHRQGFDVEPDFLDVNREYFDAEVTDLNFESPEAVETINAWVDDKTNGKIESIIESIDPETVMYLINAIYFNGTWTYEFDANDTKDRPFTAHDASARDVPMMEQETDLAYFETEEFQALNLPYGDSLYSMTVFLPREGRDVNEIVARMDGETWSGWTERFKRKAVSLRLPRFELESEIELKEVLSSLGMEAAFIPEQADFTGINRAGGLYVDNVIHKTFVQVDEEGTEAAAVTAVDVSLTSVGAAPIPMHVDRPFVFVIRERHSGTLLFMGKVLSV